MTYDNTDTNADGAIDAPIDNDSVSTDQLNSTEYIFPTETSDLGVALNDTFASNTEIVVVSGSYTQNTEADLQDYDNVRLIYQPGVTVTAGTGYGETLDIRDSQNVEVIGYGATLDGASISGANGVQAVDGPNNRGQNVVIKGLTLQNFDGGGSNHAMHTAADIDTVRTYDLTIESCDRGIEDEDDVSNIRHYNATVRESAVYPHSHVDAGEITDIKFVNCTLDMYQGDGGDRLSIGEGDGARNVVFDNCYINGRIQIQGPATDVTFRDSQHYVPSATSGIYWNRGGDGPIEDVRFVRHTVRSASDAFQFETDQFSATAVRRITWRDCDVRYDALRAVKRAPHEQEKIVGGYWKGRPPADDEIIDLGDNSIIRDVEVESTEAVGNVGINVSGQDVRIDDVDISVETGSGATPIQTGTRTRINGHVELAASPDSSNYSYDDAGDVLIDTSSTADPYDRYTVLQNGGLDGPY